MQIVNSNKLQPAGEQVTMTRRRAYNNFVIIITVVDVVVK